MRWGILHPPTFESAGAVESPQNPDFELPIVTSGPFEVTEHTPGEQVVVEARDNHPVYSPPQGIIWQAYRNEEAVIQALAGGEVDVSVENSPTNARRINNEIDNATAEIKGAHTTHQLWHVTSHPPFKFKEFRKAVNAIVNREEMIDIVFGGALDPEMEATFISQFHPFFPENPQEAGIEAQADDPTGSTEMARELLRAEGYRWDDEDRLHYPPDKDLTPVWPQGETPTVESFPCLEEYRE
jgi:peptide/nickel transport system substrate-binding protein